ncbi:MAG: hypothetical protein J0H63_12920, partial [Rhizobiales bacterium]|nr:hypothetical protein [Hyphomicrobiales bacterium]
MLWYDSAVSRWRGVSTPSSSGGIESVSGLSAPSYGLTCTRRIQTTSTAAQTSSCNAGEIMTGGGCTHTSTSFTTEDSGPTADTTWSCEWSGAGATGTAYAICCSY